MAQANPANETTTTAATLYCAIELSGKNWRLGFSRGDLQVSEQVIDCGSIDILVGEFAKAEKRLGLKGPVRRVSCYEAGRDGFWIHRALVEAGIENMVIDPTSLEVDRRQKAVKTDSIDVRKIPAGVGSVLPQGRRPYEP